MDVYTLVGKKTLRVTLPCLRSFTRHCQDDLRLLVLNDGTLDDDDCAALEAIPRLSMADPHKNADQVAAVLEANPGLRDTYAKNFLLKKLIDIPLMGGESFRFLDSDIYFFQDFTGLFSPGPGRFIMAEDVAINPGFKDMLRWPRPIHGEANAGVIQGSPPDYPACDRMLGHFVDTKPYLCEQTLYAYVWGDRPLEMVTRSTIYIARRFETWPDVARKLQRGPIAFHMTGDRKDWLDAMLATEFPRRPGVHTVRRSRRSPHHGLVQVARKLGKKILRDA